MTEGNWASYVNHLGEGAKAQAEAGEEAVNTGGSPVNPLGFQFLKPPGLTFKFYKNALFIHSLFKN